MKRLIVLTGAGMSAESGISTFRDAGGLWEQFKIEDIATPKAWLSNPDLVTEFYNKRREQVLKAKPNAAHLFLAELERYFKVSVITQNIDDLHERAGSSDITHLHGNIMLAKSSGPNTERKYYPANGNLTATDLCDEGYRLRPHVVWFGEAVPLMEKAIALIEQGDILIVIGTSLNVYPAAGLMHFASKAKLKIVVDPNANDLSVNADFIKLNYPAVEAIPKLRELLFH